MMPFQRLTHLPAELGGHVPSATTRAVSGIARPVGVVDVTPAGLPHGVRDVTPGARRAGCGGECGRKVPPTAVAIDDPGPGGDPTTVPPVRGPNLLGARNSRDFALPPPIVPQPPLSLRARARPPFFPGAVPPRCRHLDSCDNTCNPPNECIGWGLVGSPAIGFTCAVRPDTRDSLGQQAAAMIACSACVRADVCGGEGECSPLLTLLDDLPVGRFECD